MTLSTLLTPGTILQGRYAVGRAIGHGGMGAVYETIDQRLGKRLALKQILRATPQLREAFEREARLLAGLHHDALPQVSDHFSEADSDFIVMDYVEGDDLSQILQREGAIPVERVLQWAEQLLDALIYLHTRQPDPVIHRDIKPQNIKLNDRGRIILLDFGIAKGSVGHDPTTDQSVPAWTPHYAAPEQFLRSGTDARSDLYSLAATLYHLLSNQRPVAVDKRLDAPQSDQPDPLQPIYAINNRVPVVLGELLHRAMALRAAARPASAAAFRDELRALGLGDAPQPPAAGVTEVTDLSEERTGNPPRAGGANPRPAPAGGPSIAMPAVSRIQSPSQGAIRPSADPGERSVGRSGSASFQKRLHAEVRRTLDSYPGAWLVWCDPRGDWRPLLERVAGDERMGGFPLLSVTGLTADEPGGLQARRAVQDRLDAGDSFVLLVQESAHRLGWLWAHALLAERRYDKSLREQLREWGWRPHSSNVTDDELAVLTRQSFQQDPASWGGSGLQPDLPLLLEVLAGGAEPSADEAYVLTLTIEQAGLPDYQPQALARWRTRSLARLLVTEAHTLAPRLIAETTASLIPEGQRLIARELLTRWVDSLRLSKRLPEAVLEADKVAALGSQLAEANAKHGPFLSRVAEQAVFTNSCARLAQKSGKDLLQVLTSMQSHIERHALGFWADPAGRLDPALVIPWSELLRLCRAAQLLLDASPVQEWTTPDEAVAWYISGGWRLDVAGEEILRNLVYASPELLTLMTPLRDAYRSRWERTLIQWSDVWMAAGCRNPPLGTAGAWLAAQMIPPRPTAIVMIDALRYDLGSRLVTLINTQEGAERATVAPARAPLPSITALGMGAALPIPEGNLQADVVGTEWRLIDRATQTNLSLAEQRRVWLRERGIVPADGFVTIADALRGRIPAPAKNRSRICIADDIIDQLGHDDELEMLGTGIALERYRDLVMQLRDAGWRHILVVTDHGFIHWSGSTEKRVAPPLPGAAYRSRRALAYPLETTLTEAAALAPGGRWKILAARGASSWSAYGGLGYFHGGASLQEWIIPCVRVEWPSQARPVGVSIQSIKYILSARPKVGLNVERGSIFIEDALPRYVIVVILHAQQRTALFRSEQIEVNPAQDQVAVTLRLTPGAVARWDAPLLIVVRDALTEEVLAEAPSTLRAQLDEW